MLAILTHAILSTKKEHLKFYYSRNLPIFNHFPLTINYSWIK
jgi:hypothetical protein